MKDEEIRDLVVTVEGVRFMAEEGEVEEEEGEEEDVMVDSGFKFSARSLRELEGVDARLVAVTKRALQLSSQDFAVHDGIRTKAEQRALVNKGASQTMASKHITGNAVDNVPFIAGKLRWEWSAIYPIAEAMREAAREHGVIIRWGGNWYLKDFTNSTGSPEEIVAEYVAARKAQGKKAFIDGPHYELM